MRHIADRNIIIVHDLLLSSSCPYDYIRVYDGPSNSSEPIGTYCGRWREAVIYSSAESLYIEFVTKSGRAEPTRRPSQHHPSSSSSSSSSSSLLSSSSLAEPGKLYQSGRTRDLPVGVRGGGGPSFVGGGGRSGAVGGGGGIDGDVLQRSGFKARFEITGSFVNLG